MLFTQQYISHSSIIALHLFHFGNLSLTMWKLKDLGSSLENAFGTYSETEILVREATCEQPWGPTNKEMDYLCDLCDNEPEYSELMNMLWFRITYMPQKSWRRVYKGLLVLDFLIKNGPIKLVHDVTENLKYLDQIKLYQFFDEDNNDKTINIKHRASEIQNIIEDHSRLRSERRTVRNLRAKMNGLSNEYSTKNDKSFAIKTKSLINDIIDKVSSNTTPAPINKSFYQSSNRVFNKSSNHYNSNRMASNINLYTDESSDDNDRKNHKNVKEQEANSKVIEIDSSKHNDDVEEFGDFVGANSSNSYHPTTTGSNTPQNANVLFDIFGESTVTDNNPHTTQQPSATPSATTSANMLNDIFSVVDMNYPTAATASSQSVVITPSPLATSDNNSNMNFNSGQSFFDSSTTPVTQNPITTTHTPTAANNFGLNFDPFAIPTTNPSSTTTTTNPNLSNDKTTAVDLAPLDLDSLINRNIQF